MKSRSHPYPTYRAVIAILLLTVAALLASGCASSGQATAERANSRLFLQQVTADSAIVKWRGEGDVLRAGTDIEKLTLRVKARSENGHKLARLTGLRADTRYFYAIGNKARGSDSRQFRTAPAPGQLPADGNTHIWLLGDSGTATEQFRGRYMHKGEALAVKRGFLTYNREQAGSEPVDLLLLLGDNAYVAGTDAEWQEAFFDTYPDIISHTATWPTIGNHEMGMAPIDACLLASLRRCDKGPVIMPFGGISESPDPASYDSDGSGPDGSGPPYFDIFSLPTRGEAGGVASGTEQYYAFDHGNVHVVSLDSQLSNRDASQRAAMRDWLVDDLSQNKLDWTIVIFHHPPYSRGKNHDSDLERAEVDMRETFAPVFEDHGVDVVYSGHSHSYERSWYLHGHHGPSTTFDASRHAELNDRGEPALGQGDDAYHQTSRDSGSDDKVIYTVAGTAGKTDKEKPCAPGKMFGCTRPNWLTHPAHRDFDPAIAGARPHGLARRGSVVLDITDTTLTSRFVDEHGEVLDYFTIRR